MVPKIGAQCINIMNNEFLKIHSMVYRNSHFTKFSQQNFLEICSNIIHLMAIGINCALQSKTVSLAQDGDSENMLHIQDFGSINPIK